MPVNSQRTTAPDRPLHEHLRLELLSGGYAPGERLRMASLCERYGVSLSVIREALTRLSEQGLARAERNRGFAAIPMSMEDLEDLTAARVVIEQTTLRRSIARGDMSWESNIVAAHYRLSRTPIASVQDDPDGAHAWAEAHSLFHASLSGACASPRLLEIRQQLFDATEIYRVWLSQRMAGIRDDIGEHQQLMEAVLARDADLACDLSTAHIIETCEQASVQEAFAAEAGKAATKGRRKGGPSAGADVGEPDAAPAGTAAPAGKQSGAGRRPRTQRQSAGARRSGEAVTGS